MRCFEIAPSSFAEPARISAEYSGSSTSTRRRSRSAPRRSPRAEREVLQREPQRLGVGELALEQVEAGLQRRELVVGQLERRQEVALGAHAVELLAGVLVPLGVERDAEREQLRAVGVEPAREGLVRHLLVALDAGP